MSCFDDYSTVDRKKIVFEIIFVSIFQLVPIHSNSQTWIRVFGHNSQTTYGTCVVESYDGGYFLDGLTKTYPNQSQGWIIKTDVNGQLLWDLKVGSGTAYTNLGNLLITKDNGIICIGYTQELDPSSDPFILKLDKCGEKEWCNIFYTPGNMDFGVTIKPILWDDGYIAFFSYYKDLNDKRIWLLRLDNEGNTMWENFYKQDTNYLFETGFEVITTSDSCFLITAFNYTEIDPGSGLYWYSPFWIKVDKDGNEVFESTWHQPGFITGGVHKSVELNGQNFLSAGSLDVNPPNSRPSLYKISPAGDPINRTDYMPDIYGGMFNTVTLLDPPNIVLGGGYATTEDSGFSMLFKCDTSGLFLKQKDIPLTGYPPTSIIMTSDHKILGCGSRLTYNPPPLHLEACLFKFNQDLEYDSLDPRPLAYDSLCDHQIISGTIDLECNVVSIEEPEIIGNRFLLNIVPNPAESFVDITIPEFYSTTDKKNGYIVDKYKRTQDLDLFLSVFDIYGRLVMDRHLERNERQIVLDVSSWNAGLYLLYLYSSSIALASGKLVVSR